MSNYSSDDEKVIDFQIHRLCQSFGTLTKRSDANFTNQFWLTIKCKVLLLIHLFFCQFSQHLQRAPLAQACSLCPIQNSQFKIPLALFRALYRLKKRLSLWCIKGNSEAVLLYFTNCKVVIIFNNTSDTLPPLTQTLKEIHQMKKICE